MILILDKIKQNFFGGHERTARANKNILYSILIKGASMASQLALVPLTLNYLDKTQYGIWLALASIMGWFSFFDVGIGNGLRNKLSEALAKNSLNLAKIYVSTSYGLVTVIFITTMLVFWIVNPFLNWSAILNTPPELNIELSKLAFFVFSFFCLRFILLLIGNILFAYQKPAMNNLIGPLGNFVALIIIYILTKTTPGSLFWVGVTLSVAPVVVLLAFNIYVFFGKFKDVRPSIHHIHLKHSSQLLGLGFRFFIIQIAALILFSSGNIVLIQLFGPDEVTVYNVAYKYFTIILWVFGPVTSTYWSAFTEAFVKKEFDWIDKTIKRMERITYVLMAGAIVFVLFADVAIYLWVGDEVTVPLVMKIVMCLYVIVSLVSAPQLIFINGTGKVKLQFYTAIFSIIFTIPLAIFFCKTLGIGPSGFVLAMMCTSIPTAILYKVQYHKILAKRATGVWNA